MTQYVHQWQHDEHSSQEFQDMEQNLGYAPPSYAGGILIVTEQHAASQQHTYHYQRKDTDHDIKCELVST